VSFVEELEWDSSFFGVRIGRVRGGVVVGELTQALTEADERGIRCLYLLAPAADLRFLDTAQEHGFRVRDVRVELARAVAGHAAAMRRGLRPGRPQDLERLGPLARSAFRGTRFFADPGFSQERSAELYVEWLRRGLSGAGERVTLVGGDLSGFLVCEIDETASEGRISLIAVSAEVSGQGFAETLMEGAGHAFREHGLARASVVSQGHNVAALRLYERLGYRTETVSLWLHRWRGQLN
jgi:ribosomal protein S18 acetylase RimI-like enzyme